MVLKELFLRLGLEKDEASFASGMATVELLKGGLEVVADMAREAKDFLKEQISATVDAGVEARRMAQSMGLQTEEFQRLAYAAKVSEVSTETLRTGLRELAQKGVKDLGGKIIELSDRFHGMADSGAKTALAVKYFGFRGTEMIPMLNKGSAALRAMMTEAGDLGVVMSGESLEATESYMDAQHRLGGALDGLRNTVILPMLGTMTRWIGKIVETVKAFREWYVASERLGPALKVLAIVALPLLAVALWSVATAAWAAAVAAWAALAPLLPFLAIGVAIGVALAAVVLVVNDLFAFFRGGDSIIGRALHKWLGPFTGWRDALKLIIHKITAWFTGLPGPVKAALAAVAAPLLLMIGALVLVVAAVKKLVSIFEEAAPAIAQAVMRWLALFTPFLHAVEDIWATIKDGVVSAFDGVLGYLAGIFAEAGRVIGAAVLRWLAPFAPFLHAVEAVWTKLKAGVVRAFDGVLGYFKGLWAHVADLASSAGGAIVSAIRDAIESLPGGRFIVDAMSSGTPTAGAAMGGGAASPAAAAALGISAGRGGNRMTTTTIAPVIHVHAAPGMSEGELAGHVAEKVRQVTRHEIREHHDAINRETAAATG